jgi:hypothetical protein
MKKLLLVLLIVGFTTVSQAAWTLLDDFESYDNSTTTATTTVTGGVWTSVFDGTANSNIIDTGCGQVMETLGGAAWRGAERDLSGTGAAVAVDEVQTYFWQVKVRWDGDPAVTDWVYDFMMGLAPDVSNIDENNAWQDFSVMPYVNNAPTTPFINANGPNAPWWAPMAPDCWYNVWVVIDNDAADPTFDLYYSVGTAAAQMVSQDADWRNFAGNQVLNAIGFMSAGWEYSVELIDNIYYDESGQNLDLPAGIPEPMTIALLGLGGLLLRKRR